MNPDQWARVKDVFHAALERSPEERTTFITRMCDGDPILQAEVQRLLAAHAEAGGFIERSPSLGARRSLTGRIFGRYEIGRLIGSGGMGEVYAARDVELGRQVALKIGIADESAARLRREAQHAAQLNHPHICTIHEVGVTDGETYIVMEYIEGQRLQELTPPQGQAPENVVRFGIQIADALAHAHRHGVIHRDLKSANVVVTPEGRAKVLDFGLARGLSPQRLTDLSVSQAPVTAEGVVAGTLAYLAPEVLRGEQADARSDIWALGIVLYEMATGAPPFAGATGFELCAAILHGAPSALPARIPESLQDVIRRCLSKDPSQRYQRADDIRTALEAVHTDVANGTRLATLMRSGRRVLRSWRGRAAVVGVLLALALGGTVAWRSARSAPVPVGLGAAGRPAIAVMSFDNLSGGPDTAWLSKGVPTMLLAGLAQTRGLDIVSAQRLHDVIRQMGGDSLESLGRDDIAAVAQRAGAGAIVVGGISKAGSEIRIDARLEDLASGRVLAAESVRGTDLFVLVDQLAARIRDGIGFRDTVDIRKVSDISTTSLEAFQLYAQGMDAYVNTRWDDARPLLERAVAIDPMFADAYLNLAQANYALGFPGLRRDYLRKAAEHADRLSERQRLLLEAESARESGNAGDAARLIDELISKFPDTEEAYAIAGHLYSPVIGVLHNPGKWLATAAAGAAAVPRSTVTHLLYGYALLDAGRPAEAITEFETYARIAPREPNPYDSLGEVHLRSGAPERAIESFSRSLAIDPTFSGSHIGRAWGLATVGRYDDAIAQEPPQYLLGSWSSVRATVLSRVGRYREADLAIEVSRREAEMRENPEEHGYVLLVSALLALERKQYERALQDCRLAERMFATVPEKKRRRIDLVLLQLMRGLTQVRAGRIDQARVHLEMQRRLFNPAVEAENWWHKALEGEIALAAGEVEKAAAAFAAGQPAKKMWFNTLNSNLAILANELISRDGLARAARERGDLTGAIQRYRQLLSYGPDQKWVSVFEPRYVLEIARLLDRSGNRQEALKEYGRFLDFWKRADPDLPELAEARRAVQRARPLPQPTF